MLQKLILGQHFTESLKQKIEKITIFNQSYLWNVSLQGLLNPISLKIDFYVDLLISATSWASYHKFVLVSKIFQETYYL